MRAGSSVPGIWRTGAGLPAASLGADGDWYVNTNTAIVYRKSAGAYAIQLPSQTIYRLSGLVTRNVNSEASLASFNLPAGMLATDGDMLRIKFSGFDGGAAGAGLPSPSYVRVLFGAAFGPFSWPADNNTFAGTDNMPAVNFGAEILLIRRSAVTQTAMFFGWTDSRSFAASQHMAYMVNRSTGGGETLANALTVDFRGKPSFRTAIGTLSLEQASVEFIGVGQ